MHLDRGGLSIRAEHWNTFNRTAIYNEEARYAYQPSFDPDRDELSWLGQAIQYIRSEHLNNAIRFKRIFDVILGVIALVVLSPIIILTAIIIKIESPGPVFYSQERIGLNRRRSDRRSTSEGVRSERRSGRDRRKELHAGRPFKIIKLRTMQIGSEKCGPVLASDNDPRITRVGRMIRKMRVDEIPQFVNVIRGDMSIIGPRPERSFFIKKYQQELPQLDLRLYVKPGITGLAQVESGYTKNIDLMRTRLLYDLKYISRLSLVQELQIILKTFYVVLTGKGAC